ncbi:hypothetical protein [Paenibacillus sp. HJGM_3]|uniref:hypothetical protein n=1 Tax=Paenibacillus sp. HJGM_3 TaxID=3379816 RepID=UPI003859172D
MSAYSGVDRGWYQTHAFKKSIAHQVLVEKQKKYEAVLHELQDGRCIVKYRGYSDEQLAEIKKMKKEESMATTKKPTPKKRQA